MDDVNALATVFLMAVIFSSYLIGADARRGKRTPKF